MKQPILSRSQWVRIIFLGLLTAIVVIFLESTYQDTDVALAATMGFAAFAMAAGGGWLRALAVLIAVALLVKQHTMISADNLDRVDAAFFSINGILAILMLSLFTFAKILPGS